LSAVLKQAQGRIPFYPEGLFCPDIFHHVRLQEADFPVLRQGSDILKNGPDPLAIPAPGRIGQQKNGLPGFDDFLPETVVINFPDHLSSCRDIFFEKSSNQVAGMGVLKIVMVAVAVTP
jgi:hypothetical protein